MDKELYKKMYLTLFNAITDAIRAMEAEEYERAKRILIKAQQNTETLFIEGESGEIS